VRHAHATCQQPRLEPELGDGVEVGAGTPAPSPQTLGVVPDAHGAQQERFARAWMKLPVQPELELRCILLRLRVVVDLLDHSGIVPLGRIGQHRRLRRHGPCRMVAAPTHPQIGPFRHPVDRPAQGIEPRFERCIDIRQVIGADFRVLTPTGLYLQGEAISQLPAAPGSHLKKAAGYGSVVVIHNEFDAVCGSAECQAGTADTLTHVVIVAGNRAQLPLPTGRRAARAPSLLQSLDQFADGLRWIELITDCSKQCPGLRHLPAPAMFYCSIQNLLGNGDENPGRGVGQFGGLARGACNQPCGNQPTGEW